MNALLPLAQYRMDHDHMDGSGGWWLMGLFMLLAVVVLIALVVWVARSATIHKPGSPAPQPDTPLQILDRRLAEGDVTPEDYESRAAILRRS